MAISLLLADDSPTIAKILTMALSSEDYAIRTVETADQAIQEITRDPPAFFLVDAALPGQDGFALSRLIKSSPDWMNKILVVLLANAFDPVDEASATAAGIDAIVVKPFDPAELRSRLRALVGKSPNLANNSPNTTGVDEPPLSPSAQALANFFSAEVDTNNAKAASAITNPSPPSPPDIELSPSAQALANFFSAEVEANQAKAAPEAPSAPVASEELDFTQVETDWNALSQWSSNQQNPSPDMFDTGESSFVFTPDYAQKITRAFAGTHEEEQANRKKPLNAEMATAPAYTEAPPQKQPQQVPAMTRDEMERIIREEVRAACKEAVEKITWEVIPELAENLIRKELEKVMQSMDV